MSLELSIITSLTLVHGKLQKIIHFRLADPVFPLDPGYHIDMICACEKHILAKGHAGSRGGGGILRNKLEDCTLKMVCTKLTFLSQ